MKFLFTLSVVANFGLGAGLVLMLPGHHSGDHARASVAAAVESQSDAGNVQETSFDDHSTSPRLAWSHLTAAPMEEFVAGLRAAGWPERLVRQLAREEIDRRNPPVPAFSQRKDASFEFWVCDTQGTDEWSGQLAEDEAGAIRRRREQNENQFCQLFGDDPSRAGDASEIVEPAEQRIPANLSADKRKAVEKILADGEAMQRKVFAEIKGPMLASDRAALAMISREVEADIAEVLTPEEYLEYRLRNSDTARRMREQLGRFAPSREEFLAIFKIREAFEKRFETRWQGESANAPERLAALAKVDQQILTVLGEQRFADYRRATDPQFARLEALARRSHASTETVVELYELAQTAAQSPDALDTVKESFVRALGAEATLAFFGKQG